jgi:2-dehydro-3-deoxygalactonokinase
MMRANHPTFFLSCDWGSSSFRLRLVRRADAEVVDESRSGEGAAMLAQDRNVAARRKAFDHLLSAQAARLLLQHGLMCGDVPVVVSGMASSSVGWHELPYARVPFRVDGRDAATKRVPFGTPDSRGRALLVSGIRTDDEVMRGEEAELLGLFSRPAWRGLADGCVVILPGTHSKHVVVKRRRAVDFRTYMTGELYAVLGAHSMLRHSVAPVGAGAGGKDGQTAFEAGVDCAKGRALSEALFRVRTNALFQRYKPGANAAFLSGVLIGTEAHDLAARGGRTPVVLCAAGPLLRLYARAFERAGIYSRVTVVGPSEVDRLSVYGHAVLLDRFAAAR